MHSVGLVEGTAVDADAEVGPCCKGEACTGPKKQKTHGTGQQGGNAEGNGERKQELTGTRHACGPYEWLGCGKLEDSFRGGENGKKRKYCAYAENFSK